MVFSTVKVSDMQFLINSAFQCVLDGDLDMAQVYCDQFNEFGVLNRPIIDYTKDPIEWSFKVVGDGSH